MGINEYFKDKSCLVTGANSGIGYALTEALLEKGAIVFMAGRSPDSLQKRLKASVSIPNRSRF